MVTQELLLGSYAKEAFQYWGGGGGGQRCQVQYLWRDIAKMYIHACMRTHINVHMKTHVHAPKCSYSHACMHTHMYACMHMQIHQNICIFTFLHENQS